MAMDLPYSDLTIVEVAEAVAGPMASLMFADMGAEVIKVEKPGIGDVLGGMSRRKAVSARTTCGPIGTNAV